MKLHHHPKACAFLLVDVGTWIICAGVCMLALPAVADEPEIAWRVDFDSSAEIGGAHYAIRKGTESQDGLVFDVKDGKLTFGPLTNADFGALGRTFLAWGRSMPWGYWQWSGSPFKEIDVAKFPIVEFRARKAPGADLGMQLVPSFDSDAGATFVQLHFRLADDWKVFKFRFSPLSSVPGPRTPRVLKGLAFCLIPSAAPSSKETHAAIEIDWIRVQAFTAEERAQDEVIARNVRRYRVPDWKQPFFVYGPYGPSLRNVARQGGFEGAYGAMVRAHMNFMMAPHCSSYYRFDDKGNMKGQTLIEKVDAFIEVNRRAVTAAESVGFALCLDVRGLHRDLVARGPQYIRPAIQKITDAFRDSPAVFGYTVADEPKTVNLWEIIGVKQIFEESDATRLVSWAQNDAYWASDFEAYSTIHVGDKYSIKHSRRDCRSVAAQMDEYNRKTEKPVWFIIQAYGAKEWWPAARKNGVMPTPAEFRRMAFMAVSRGAKGVLYFDWFHRPWETLVDRYGNPGPVYDAASSLGERLAAVGSVLLRADVEREGAPPSPAEREDSIEILPLRLDRPKGRVYVVCNTSVEHAVSTFEVNLPSESERNLVAFDLESMTVDPGPALRGRDLAPGDGRFFALVSREDAERLKKEILENRSREAERVARPNRVIVQRWGAAGEEMETLGRDLDACAVKLGALDRALTAGVEKARPGKEPEWECYSRLGRAYDGLRSRWIAADRDGLAQDVTKLKRDVVSLGWEVLEGEGGGAERDD